jgi:hypothetical protein
LAWFGLVRLNCFFCLYYLFYTNQKSNTNRARANHLPLNIVSSDYLKTKFEILKYDILLFVIVQSKSFLATKQAPYILYSFCNAKAIMQYNAATALQQ